MPEHDCLPPDVSASDFVVHMARMSGLRRLRGPRARRRRAAPRRPGRGALPPDGWLLHRHEAARQARPGPGPRPPAGAPRRADQRARPGRARRHAAAGAAHRQRLRHRGPRHLPPARRARAGQRPRGRARRRAAAAARAHRRVPRAHRQPARRGDRHRRPSATASARPSPAGPRVSPARRDGRGRPTPPELAGEGAAHDLVRDTAAELGLGLVRLQADRRHIEDVFLDGGAHV